jgi:hypothetical protein
MAEAGYFYARLDQQGIPQSSAPVGFPTTQLGPEDSRTKQHLRRPLPRYASHDIAHHSLYTIMTIPATMKAIIAQGLYKVGVEDVPVPRIEKDTDVILKPAFLASVVRSICFPT